MAASRNRPALVALAMLACSTGALACWWHLDCDEADAQAEALLAQFGACPRNEVCRVFFIGSALEGANELGVCIDSLQCSVAIREGADGAALIERGRDIVSRRRCNVCTFAKCRKPDELEAFCNPATRRCDLRGREVFPRAGDSRSGS